jgi:hypothetical protein
MHLLLERSGDGAPRSAIPTVEHVGDPFPPGRVGHFRDHRLDRAPVRGVEEEKTDGVEADAQVARVCQHPDRPGRLAPDPLPDQLASPLAEAGRAPTQVVLAVEAGGRRPAGRPERNRVEQLRQLVQVEERHEDAVAEAVGHRAEPAMRHPAGVDGGGGHAASASSSAAGPIVSVSAST